MTPGGGGRRRASGCSRKKAFTDSFAIPFRWVCKVAVRKDGKYDHGGSGLLISDRHVLTAAHVVYDVYKNRAQYDLDDVGAGRKQRSGYLSSSSKPEIPALYEPEKVDYDYALITLDNSIGEKKFKELKGDKLCFWGSPDCGAGTELVGVDPKSLVTQTAYTAGYPKNKGAAAMWSFSGLLAYVGEKDRTMTFTGEATEGQWFAGLGSARRQVHSGRRPGGSRHDEPGSPRYA